nr:unnamed protein product [Haemonchus contortus]
MIRLVVLLSLLAFSLACKPSSSTSASATTASTAGGAGAGGAGTGGTGTGGTGTGATGTGGTGTGGTGTGGTGTGGTAVVSWDAHIPSQLERVSVSVGTHKSRKLLELLRTGASRGKREVDEIDQANVVVETKLKFNPELNSFFMNAFREAVEQHASATGVKYSDAVVQERMHQVGDKLAMEYFVHGVDCEQLASFISAGKLVTEHLIGNVTAMCNGTPMVL